MTSFLILVLVILPGVIYGQYTVDYKHFTTNDGLSHGSVVNIIRDSKGFMWFSTWDGLNRFDGVTFKTYKTMPGDNLSLSSNRIVEILEDKYNSLWLKTYDSKIFRLNLITEKFDDEINRINDSIHSGIDRLFLSSSGDLWLTTEQDGIFQILTDSLTNIIRTRHFHEGAGNSQALVSNHIDLIFEDPGKEIWITEGGSLYHINSDAGYRVETLSPGSDDASVIPGYLCSYNTENQVLIGSNSGEILFLSPADRQMEFTKVCSSPVNVIHVHDNNIYVGTQNEGLFVIDRVTKLLKYRYLNSYLESVYTIFEDSHGLLWLETNAEGAVKVDPENRSTKLFTQKVDVENVRHVNSRCLFTEVDQVLWLTLKGGGFGYYDRIPDKLNYFYNEPGSPDSRMSNFVYSYHIDKSNVLWLSSYRKGIEQFTLLRNKFKSLAPEPDSKNKLANEVRAVYEDHLGILWIATKSGAIYLLDKDYRIISRFSEENRLRPMLVYSIIEDKSENIWLGTKGEGLFRVRRKGSNGFSIEQFRNIKDNPASLSNDNIYSLAEGDDGKIWIATYGGGLNLLEPENDRYVFKTGDPRFSTYPENCCRQIRQVKTDNRGNLWLATTEGLVFFNPHETINGNYKFHHFIKGKNDSGSLGNNDVYCIYQDRDEILWFGTLGGGLQKLVRYPSSGEQARFEVLTKENGLASDIILSIEGDNDNNLWMSSENGIIKYNTHNHLFRNYNEHDGIHVYSFSENASAVRKNGELVYGTYNGLCYFQPGQIVEDEEKCNLYFTGLKVLNENVTVKNNTGILNKSIVFTDKLELKYNQNIFELYFAALDFRAINKIQYLYRLEGYDDNWRKSDIGNALYTKIPPGKYTFRVKIANPEIELNTPATLDILVKKPYWKTDLAYAVYALISLFLLFITWRILDTVVSLRNKVAFEKQLSEMKIKYFTNISHEIRTPLTLIQGPVREIEKHEVLSEKGKEYIRLINTNTGRMLRLVNQLLDFRKIQRNKLRLKLSQVNFGSFVRQLCSNFENLAAEKGIEFILDLNAGEEKIWIDEEKMDMVIFNLLSNAFKFTPGGKKIMLLLEKEGDELLLSVQDQGIGIKESKKKLVFQSYANIHEPSGTEGMSTGLGLALSRELVELHGGTISFSSKEGSGSTFTIRLRTGKDHFDRELVTFATGMEYNGSKEDSGSYPGQTDQIQTFIPDPVKNQRDRILVVEDNHEIRQYIKSILSGEYEIDEASNGNEGYEKAQATMPRMIISDVIMPELDGIEMLKMLRADFNTSHIPVILLTARSSIENRIEGLECGADAYLTKPFDSDHLRTQVANLIKLRKKLIEKYSGAVRITDYPDEEILVTEKDSEFLVNVSKIIEENLGDPEFKVELIARNIGMGRTKFFDKLKGLTGMSPIDFIKEYRLNKAVHLLDSGNYNVSEVSFKTGFQDPGYFTRCFREKFGETPTQYIKSSRSADPE